MANGTEESGWRWRTCSSIVLAVTVFANVSLLVFARAASRESGIGVRNALGASRGRMVLQLFVEAVALSALSVVAGLVAARYALGSLWHLIEADSGRALPFSINDSLTTSTIAYGVGLTMLAAVIIGVFPALRVGAGRGCTCGFGSSQPVEEAIGSVAYGRPSSWRRLRSR